MKLKTIRNMNKIPPITLGLSPEEHRAVNKACAVLKLEPRELVWLGLNQVMEIVPAVLADNHLTTEAHQRFNHAEMPAWAGKEWPLC